MQQATFLIDRNEFNESFVKKIRSLFKGSKHFSVTVSTEEDMDETTFITRHPKNKAMLDSAIKNINAGKTTAVDIDQYLKK